jgi:E3 ubiquitin-protein ligase HUWE1
MFCHFQLLKFLSSKQSKLSCDALLYSQLGNSLNTLSHSRSRIEYNQNIQELCQDSQLTFCNYLRNFKVNWPQLEAPTVRNVNVSINRNHNVLEFAQNQIHAFSDEVLQRGRLLHVKFVNEQGADAGGLTKEWFALVVNELKKPENNLFKKVDGKSGEKYLPNPNSFSPENLISFEFIGRFIGLAIRHQIQLDMDFVPFVLLRILGIKMRFDDLQYFDENLYKNVKHLNENVITEDQMVPYSVKSVVDKIAEQYFKDIPDDEERFLTESNKQEFLNTVTKVIAEDLCKDQIIQMQKGLLSVIPNLGEIPAESLDELLTLISGKEIVINDWKLLTAYENGYTEDSESVRLFWQVLESFDQKERQAILKFWTAYTRLTSTKVDDGLVTKVFTIAQSSADSNAFANTCINQFHLPDKRTESDMKSLLNSYVTFINAHGHFLTA